MGSKKEDERNEKIIRGLLKQPANRKCINCNTLGPQYVCTTFSTFVCTTCGGIHREFTHRVKSVSMAKFTPQEIASLQAGGNECAKEIFFKDWEPQRQSPDSSNVDRLRTFIKHVYVDRKYTGERISDRPPRVKQGDKEEPNEHRRSNSSQSGSRSPAYDEPYERRHSARSSPGYYDVKRSPGYEQENQRHSDYGRSPVRSGIVNDWRREDRFSNGRKSDDRRSSDGESKPEIRSPESQKDSSIASPPAVRPVRDILGDNVPPLRISEPPKVKSSRAGDGATITQRTASSSSLASSNGNPTELKRELTLIDFDAESEPPVTAAATQGQPLNTVQSFGPSTSTPSNDNWASFDAFAESKISQAAPSSDLFGSVLTELSVPAPAHVPGSVSTAVPTPSNGMIPSSSTGDFLFDSLGNVSVALSGNPGASAMGNLSSFPPGTAQWPGMQSQHQPSSVGAHQSAPQLVSAFPSGSGSQGLTSNPTAQGHQIPPAVAQALQAAPAPVPQTVETKSSSRTELPADLFAPTYPSILYQGPAWQTGQVPGMGYPMQYNTGMSMPAFPQPTKSSNPFDVNAEASPAHAAVFPTMSSLHAALPNMAAPGGLVHASNLGGVRPSWIRPQSTSYPSSMPPPASSFGSAMPGPYMNQQVHSNMTPSRPQGFGSYGSEGTQFGSLNPAVATPNPSLGGNPFG